MKSGIVGGDMKLKASYSYKGYELKSQWFKILYWKALPSVIVGWFWLSDFSDWP